MSKGFATKTLNYRLSVNAGTIAHIIDFVVDWQGSEYRTHEHANAVGISVFSVIQYGETSDAYPKVEAHLGTETCDSLVSIHEQLKGTQFIGKVRAKSSGRLLAQMASHIELVPRLKEYNAASIAERLA